MVGEPREGRMTIDQLLTTLDALHEAATAGEWAHSDIYAIRAGDVDICEAPMWMEPVDFERWQENRAWIIAAHNHYPALSAESKRLRAENAALSQRLREQSAKAGDEVHKMQAELATAKRIGAAEELRRPADEWRKERPGWIHQCNVLCYRAAELEGKNAV